MFEECKLSNNDLSDIQVRECKFVKSLMVNCVFQQLKSKETNKKFDLVGCEFVSTSLDGSVFVFCDLTDVGFQKSSLAKVVFERCILAKTDFSEADIDEASFDASRVEKAILDVDGFIKLGNSKGFVLKN
jgi:uncharacterized protein YjbI with pentapeptide repeats